MAGKKIKPATYEAAWAPEAPEGDVWTPRPWVHPAQREEEGRAARKRVPRVSHAAFELRPERDPIAILEAQEADRLPELVPLRHARMAESPFAYYRGTPAVMAFDLATAPRTDIIVQASGDAHISNFGVFASPERQMVFDTNDFDETLPAPWEWDVKRLAASMLIAARDNGYRAKLQERIVLRTVEQYRTAMRTFAAQSNLEVWYARLEIETLMQESAADLMPKRIKKDTEKALAKARARDSMFAFSKLTRQVNGSVRIIDQSPLIVPLDVLAPGETCGPRGYYAAPSCGVIPNGVILAVSRESSVRSETTGRLAIFGGSSNPNKFLRFRARPQVHPRRTFLMY